VQGGFAKSVLADIWAVLVVGLCTTLASKHIVLEEFVSGREFRATVVVDGKSSIGKHFDAKNLL